MKTLSVILPVYNAAPYIEETVESLLQQSRPADQIIIINDGSSDHSLELLHAMQTREERICIISQENAGVSSARNRGLEICNTDYIALIDADDICDRSRFEVQLNAMEQDKLDICGSWIKTFGRRTREITYPTTDRELKWNFLFFGRTIPNPTTMLRRAAIEGVHYREGLSFGEDYGFFLEALVRKPEIRFANIDRPLVNYRLHEQQASQRLADRNQDSLLLLLNDLLPIAGIAPTRQQLKYHYSVWAQQEKLSEVEIQDYLPFMGAIFSWFDRYNRDNQQAKRYWKMFLNLQKLSFLSRRRLSKAFEEYINVEA